MVYRLSLAQGMAAALAVPVSAQNAANPAPQPPALAWAPQAGAAQGAAPRFVIVSKVDEKKGEIVLSQTMEQMVPVQVVEKVKQGNQEVAVVKTTMKSM